MAATGKRGFGFALALSALVHAALFVALTVAGGADGFRRPAKPPRPVASTVRLSVRTDKKQPVRTKRAPSPPSRRSAASPAQAAPPRGKVPSSAHIRPAAVVSATPVGVDARAVSTLPLRLVMPEAPASPPIPAKPHGADGNDGVAVAAEDAPPTGAPEAVSAPSVQGEVVPRYPESARRRGEEGMVTLEINVDERGIAISTRIVVSSGFKALDDAARRAFARAKFLPALRDGVAVSGTVRVPLVFRLRSPGP